MRGSNEARLGGGGDLGTVSSLCETERRLRGKRTYGELSVHPSPSHRPTHLRRRELLRCRRQLRRRRLERRPVRIREVVCEAAGA